MSRERAAEALRAGKPIIVPTDTVYGMVALATDHDAIASIFALKQRPTETHMALLVADLQQAETLVELGPDGHRLAVAFWPGAFTIVAPRRPGHDLTVGGEDTVGVRCPDDEFLRELADEVGPIAATSANLPGEEPLATAADLAIVFPTVELIVDGGERRGHASTVVTVVDGPPIVLREGPISALDIDAVLSAGP